jgi:hypothetical protein
VAQLFSLGVFSAMRNITFLLLVVSALFKWNICIADEWFYGTWYFDRDFTRSQLTNSIPKFPTPKSPGDTDWNALLPDEVIKQLNGTIYKFTTNEVTITIKAEAHTIAYTVFSRPATNQVILRYANGYTNSFWLTNGLLEVNGNVGMKYYYHKTK